MKFAKTFVQMSVALGLVFVAACGRDGGNQAQNPPPGYVPQVCQAGQVIDYRSGQCVSIDAYQAQQAGQYFKTHDDAPLTVTNYTQYKKFIKEFTTGTIMSYCGRIGWSGWHPTIEDCYNVLVGNQALLDIRFPSMIQSSSSIPVGLASGVNAQAVSRMALNMSYHPRNDNTNFELSSAGVPGTYSWSGTLKIVTTSPINFTAATGVINDSALNISVIYRDIEIARGTIYK